MVWIVTSFIRQLFSSHLLISVHQFTLNKNSGEKQIPIVVLQVTKAQLSLYIERMLQTIPITGKIENQKYASRFKTKMKSSWTKNCTEMNTSMGLKLLAFWDLVPEATMVARTSIPAGQREPESSTRRGVGKGLSSEAMGPGTALWPRGWEWITLFTCLLALQLYRKPSTWWCDRSEPQLHDHQLNQSVCWFSDCICKAPSITAQESQTSLGVFVVD